MATVFYNEFDPFAAAWLRNLAAAGHLPAGVVDERDIKEVTGDDVKGYAECHFFAGVGGWPLALRLAGWPATAPVWTGSCPCQPFSSAGRRKGKADSRHLWPEFLRLIAECRPAALFGEQVASNLGREWLAGVRADLEALGYAVGAADLCAAGVAAPHIRQRLYWVADRVGYADSGGRPEGETVPRRPPAGPGLPVSPGWLGNAYGEREAPFPGVPAGPGTERARGPGFWDAYDLVHCRDDKLRRVEPGTFPLVDRTPARVGRLRGYGNAVVPQAAAAFVRTFLGCAAPGK
jgi:DNA (cytosine-5)-methyltransferase 1